MDVRIGIQNSPRELGFETSQSAAEVEQAVAAALAGQSPLLKLADDKGTVYVVPVRGTRVRRDRLGGVAPRRIRRPDDGAPLRRPRRRDPRHRGPLLAAQAAHVRQRRSCPPIGAGVAAVVWVALTWLGWAWDGGWIWVVSLVAGGARLRGLRVAHRPAARARRRRAVRAARAAGRQRAQRLAGDPSVRMPQAAGRDSEPPAPAPTRRAAAAAQAVRPSASMRRVWSAMSSVNTGSTCCPARSGASDGAQRRPRDEQRVADPAAAPEREAVGERRVGGDRGAQLRLEHDRGALLVEDGAHAGPELDGQALGEAREVAVEHSRRDVDAEQELVPVGARRSPGGSDRWPARTAPSRRRARRRGGGARR